MTDRLRDDETDDIYPSLLVAEDGRKIWYKRRGTDYTNSSIIKRQLRREWWLAFSIALAWFTAGILLLMGLAWFGLSVMANR